MNNKTGYRACLVTGIAMLISGELHAGRQQCNDVLAQGIFNVHENKIAVDKKHALVSYLCSSEGGNSSSGGSGGLSVNVFDLVSGSIAGSGKTLREWQKQNCSGQQNEDTLISSTHLLIQEASSALLDSWVECMKISDEPFVCYAKETDSDVQLIFELSHTTGGMSDLDVGFSNLTMLSGVPENLRWGKRVLLAKRNESSMTSSFVVNGDTDYFGSQSCAIEIPPKRPVGIRGLSKLNARELEYAWSMVETVEIKSSHGIFGIGSDHEYCEYFDISVGELQVPFISILGKVSGYVDYERKIIRIESDQDIHFRSDAELESKTIKLIP